MAVPRVASCGVSTALGELAGPDSAATYLGEAG